MQTRTLTLLAAAAVVVIGGAAAVILARAKPVTSVSVKERLLPGLAARANDVVRITVRGAATSYSLALQDGRWGLVEKDHYPALFDEVKKAVVGIADLEGIERKTTKPDLYARIGVGGPEAGDSEARLVTLWDAGGAEIAAVILGKTAIPATANQVGSLYVRLPEDPQSWLAESRLRLPPQPLDWVDRTVTELRREDVFTVTITHPDGETVVVRKERPYDDNYSVVDMPTDVKLAPDANLSSIHSALDYFRFDDVAPAATTDLAAQPVATTAFYAFKGLVLTVTTGRVGGKLWAKLAADATSPQDPDLPIKTEEERAQILAAGPQPPTDQVKADAAALTTRLAPWAFQIQDHKADYLAKRRKALLASQ